MGRKPFLHTCGTGHLGASDYDCQRCLAEEAAAEEAEMDVPGYREPPDYHRCGLDCGDPGAACGCEAADDDAERALEEYLEQRADEPSREEPAP